jgi:hypothetical protein
MKGHSFIQGFTTRLVWELRCCCCNVLGLRGLDLFRDLFLGLFRHHHRDHLFLLDRRLVAAVENSRLRPQRFPCSDFVHWLHASDCPSPFLYREYHRRWNQRNRPFRRQHVLRVHHPLRRHSRRHFRLPLSRIPLASIGSQIPHRGSRGRLNEGERQT